MMGGKGGRILLGIVVTIYLLEKQRQVVDSHKSLCHYYSRRSCSDPLKYFESACLLYRPEGPIGISSMHEDHPLFRL